MQDHEENLLLCGKISLSTKSCTTVTPSFDCIFEMLLPEDHQDPLVPQFHFSSPGIHFIVSTYPVVLNFYYFS